MADGPRDEWPDVVVRRGGEHFRGRRPGDERLRIQRRRSQVIRAKVDAARRSAIHPAVTFVYGFGALILVGTLLLVLPISSADRSWTPFLDALFTATSAVCVTGLVVVDTGSYWSLFGQAIILVLIQLGGFGFMTSATLLFVLIGQRVTLRQRMLVREAMGGGPLGTIPPLLKRLLAFTVIVEAAGVAVLLFRFLATDGVGLPRALWLAVFHAVSAFNNAGFDVFGDFRSLSEYQEDPLVLLPISGLFLLGGVSYVALEDLVGQRRLSRLALNTKLVLVTSGSLLLIGTIVILATEWSNPKTLGSMSEGMRLLTAFFQSATARTAGFSSIGIGDMTEPALVTLMGLMFIGGAAASTAGGIKVQTFSIIFSTTIAAIRGLPDVIIFQRRVRPGDLFRAVAVVTLASMLVFVVSLILEFNERSGYVPFLFEAISAFGTVGLSMGVTPETSQLSRSLLIVTMFAGRLGPLTLALALLAREQHPRFRWPAENIRIG